MGKRERDKGKRGEREAAAALRALGFNGARRGAQIRGGPDSPDIIDAIPGVHFEVKRTEALSLYAALAQAQQDADGAVPVVLHRRNLKPWVAIVELARLRDLTQCLETEVLLRGGGNGEPDTRGNPRLDSGAADEA